MYIYIVSFFLFNIFLVFFLSRFTCLFVILSFFRPYFLLSFFLSFLLLSSLFLCSFVYFTSYFSIIRLFLIFWRLCPSFYFFIYIYFFSFNVVSFLSFSYPCLFFICYLFLNVYSRIFFYSDILIFFNTFPIIIPSPIHVFLLRF